MPSRLRQLLDHQSDDQGLVLAAMTARLQGAGAQALALAMPCNTAHHYAGAIRAAVAVPLIDMVALSVAEAARLAGRGGRVGILCSPAVRQVGLFDAALLQAGLQPVYAADGDAMLAAIRSLKARGPNDEARAMLSAASARMLAEGAVIQMIACTEFSLIADALVSGATGFDTLDQLVKGIVAFATEQAEA